MALTNPNTPVSQQDLQDFYNKIKPYMGIYPSSMGKRVGKGDIYSTSERLIGQWYDGKPLYQKTLVGTISVDTDKTSKNTTIGNVSEEVDTVVSIDGIRVHENKSVFVSLSVTSSLTNNSVYVCNLFVNNSTGNLVLEDNRLADDGRTVIATVKYTKTTDSAIAIGDDTDYSTEEKIVGTWIDGKPVYQKTIQIGDIAVVSSVTYKNLGVTNADTLISSKLWYTFSDGNKFDSEFLIAYNYGYACPYIDYASHKIYMAYKTSIALSDMFAIIQYTKTTD